MSSSVEELSIVLEHDIDQQYQYEPGEVIRGNVRVRASRPTPVRTITLRVVGEGNVSWREDQGEGGGPGGGGGGGGGGGKQPHHHQVEEKYVDVSKVVMDAQRERPHTLLPGYSNFPFQYQLPDNLPSSFIGKFGNVTFTLKASLVGVKATDTAITSEPFLILRRSQLPASAAQSLHLAAERRFWAACTFGKVRARITLDGRGGVPGEDVFMHAEVKNQSARTVTGIQASLMMLSSYQAQNNSIGFSQVVSKKRDEVEVERGDGRRWNYVRLSMPPYIPETGLEHCDIIHIHYLFQFRVEISGGAELRMEAPFLIGSHFQGQEELPRRSQSQSGQHPPEQRYPAFPSPNNQWSSQTHQGFHFDNDNGNREKTAITIMDLGGGEPPNPWGLDSRVPELQDERSVVRNPLFQQGSFSFKVKPTDRGAQEEETTTTAAAAAAAAPPEEQMENTQL